MDVLTGIYDEIVSLMGGMTTLDGYNFNWHPTSIDPTDWDIKSAQIAGGFDQISEAYPIALIHWGDETVDTPTMNGLGVGGNAYTNDQEFILEVQVGATSSNTVDEKINKATRDLKKLFYPSQNNSLNCKSFIVLYTGTRRDVAFSDQLGCSGRFTFNILVRYSQDVNDVDQLV